MGDQVKFDPCSLSQLRLSQDAPKRPFDTSKLPSLFEQIKKEFPSSISPHGWYILAASALITVSNPANINFLYEYLISQPEWSSHEQRRILSRRLREQMLKQWTVIGIPKVITAVRALATVEAPEDADDSFSKEGESMSQETRDRGRELCHAIYGEDRFQDIMASWGSMRKDITWTADNIIYGIFLSDERVLSRQETTVMSYSSMACMGLLGTSRRHLVGLRNNGADDGECNAVISCTKIIADWGGVETDNWITVDDLTVEPKGKEMHDQIKTGQI